MISPPGFARDFSPRFVSWLSTLKDIQILVEDKLGSDMNYSASDYACINKLRIATREEVFAMSDLILSITCPMVSDITIMRRKSLLIAMLHYETHPTRNALLAEKGIVAISLDSIIDYEGKRLVQDYHNTAWNAVTEGFIQLRNLLKEPYWFNPNRKPINVYLLGTGQLGREALAASLKMGNTLFQDELIAKGGNPLVSVVPTNSLHSSCKYHQQLFRPTGSLAFPNMIIDASKRIDFSKHILNYNDICLLPKNCVIVDITADRYEGDTVVKGIQGIPTGNEVKYVFLPNDPEWNDSYQIPLDYQIPKKQRRVVVSHYSWPSYGTKTDRMANMEKYECQLCPIVELLLKRNLKATKPYDDWSLERALCRAMRKTLQNTP